MVWGEVALSDTQLGDCNMKWVIGITVFALLAYDNFALFHEIHSMLMSLAS